MDYIDKTDDHLKNGSPEPPELLLIFPIIYVSIQRQKGNEYD